MDFVLANAFSGGGNAIADVVAIAIAVVAFALIYWAIDLLDKI